MILGLDISTSNLGFCIFEEKKLYDAGAISFKSGKSLYTKAEEVEILFEEINKTVEINRILIEENLQSFRSGFSSAKTISTLAKFNGIVSYIAFRKFNLQPEFMNVSSARSKAGLKIERKSSDSTKDQVLNWVKTKPEFSSFSWPTKTLKSGPRKNLCVDSPSCYDIADAAILCFAAVN